MDSLSAVCTFCGLLCDDLEVRTGDGSLQPVRGACERSRAAFASLGRAAAAAARPRIAGQPTTLGEALESAARLLRTSRRPLISGLETDVAGMRAATNLARRTGAVVDHANAQAKYRNLHVLQEAGWITTTLSEVRNRADVVVLAGEGWYTRMPRFAERVLVPPPLFANDSAPRRFVLLGPNGPSARAILPAESPCLEFDGPMDALPELFAMLAALAAGRPADPARLRGVDAQDLAECSEWLGSARYGVFVWAAADFDFPHAELAMHALSRLLKVLNRKGRFAGLPLAGNDGDLTASAVQTWQAGLPLPASYANGLVDFDPQRFALARVLARADHDLLVWISSLGTGAVPATPGKPAIVLGRADRRFEREPEVFIPVATPGIDAPGHLLRSDKVVTMHAPRLRESALPTVADVVGRLLERLGPPC